MNDNEFTIYLCWLDLKASKNCAKYDHTTSTTDFVQKNERTNRWFFWKLIQNGAVKNLQIKINLIILKKYFSSILSFSKSICLVLKLRCCEKKKQTWRFFPSWEICDSSMHYWHMRRAYSAGIKSYLQNPVAHTSNISFFPVTNETFLQREREQIFTTSWK